MASSSADTAQPPENEIAVFEDDGAGRLREKEIIDLEGFLTTPQQSSTQIICASLKLPADFRHTLTADQNASFHTEYGFTEDKISRHVSWSLFKIKLVKNSSDYHWVQASVFVNWDTKINCQQVFFIGVPADEQKQIKQSFPSLGMRDRNPYIWHAVFAHKMVYLYNKSFWQLRNVVRKVETDRSASSENLPVFFKELNDTGRHAVHLIETMEVAEHTVNSLVLEHSIYQREFPSETPALKNLHIQTGQRIAFIAKEIHSLKTRAKTLSDRLASEIQLANNLVSHEMSKNTRYDSLVTKTLSFVGMIYLPGTFVSAKGIFGSNFFDFQSGEKESWEMSNKFWLYWAVTVPLTVATFIVWALWHYRTKLTLNSLGKKDRELIGKKDASNEV
ncbi:hypothetical protein BBP40_009030 [Aspergillus hancockii]|nr:hypothetical protein BBP40_009030 [Aspergillus hancockii]